LKIFRTVTAQRLLDLNQENVMRKHHYNHRRHPRPSDTAVSRGEGDPGGKNLSGQGSWIPFPRVLRTLAGDDKWGISAAALLTAAIVLDTTSAFADMSTDPETVVVTATRTPQPLALTGTSMSVITADDLKIQQTAVVTDILAETPGLMVNRAGGVGQPTSISIRGAETGQTLVLIDGARINDPSATDEGTILGDILVNNIDRIEVLRGPQSTLYGSDAIGGVVNVITRRGGETPFGGTAMAEGGSFDTWHLNAAASGTADNVEYGAAVNWFDTGGISAADLRNGNTEADGYRNFGATFNTHTHLGEGWSVDLRGYTTHGHDDFDDNFPPPFFRIADSAANNTNALFAGYAGVNAALGPVQNRLALIATHGTRDYFDSASDIVHLNYDYTGNATRFEYQGVVDFDPANQLTFGAETEERSFRNDSFGLNALFSPPVQQGHDRISSGYAQMQGTLFDQLTLTGGVRYDDDKEFGGHTSLKLAGAWRIPGWGTTLRANYGDGFKAPSLYESFSQYSNPLHPLDPETAKGWEVGADQMVLDNRVRASLTYFQRHTHNQIDFQTCFTPADAPGCPYRLNQFGYYENLDRTEASGIEAEIDAHISDALSLTADYTSLTAKNVLTGTELARRPHSSASGVITWLPLPKLTLGTSVVFLGPRFDDGGNFTLLDSNTTVNVFGSYALTDRLELFARVENLADERNEPIAGYGRMGRAAYGGIRAAF
jgi:vitamin B12 transporter